MGKVTCPAKDDPYFARDVFGKNRKALGNHCLSHTGWVCMELQRYLPTESLGNKTSRKEHKGANQCRVGDNFRDDIILFEKKIKQE
jgi:hypothetical protein